MARPRPEKKPLTRRDVAVIIAIAIGVLGSIVAVILWEMGRECVRWSTRVDANKAGTYLTEVCAEFVPRRDSPKTK